jgi:hypothetical protein
MFATKLMIEFLPIVSTLLDFNVQAYNCTVILILSKSGKLYHGTQLTDLR